MILTTIANRPRPIAALGLALLFCATSPAADTAAHFQQQAQQIFDATGVRGGLVVHLGCGHGKLTAALGTDDRYLVHGLDTDAGNVKAAREHIRSLGLYGKVSVEHWSAKTLPYNDNQVNLLVIEAGVRIPDKEITRVLCPEGVACAGELDKWTTRVKPRPDDIDEWTHFLHGPDNNAVARDRQVTTPRHLQWQAEPKRTRDHDALASFSAMTSSAGRIFYILDEGLTSLVHHPARWQLIARDAFNGKLLWKRAIDSWVTHLRYFRSGPSQLPRRLVSVGDRVYATLGIDAPVTALDAATGNTLLTFRGSENAEEFICHDGILLAVIGDLRLANRYAPKADNYWDFYVEEEPEVGKSVIAFDAKTGKRLWHKKGKNLARLVPLSLTAGGDRAFYLDNQVLHCVDLDSGEPVWTAPFPTEGQFLLNYAPTVLHHKDTVVCLSVKKLAVFSARDGRQLWENKGYAGFASPGDLFVVDDLVWTFPGIQAIKTKPQDVPGAGKDFLGFDLYTGEVKRTFQKGNVWPGGHHHRCYRNKATERFIICGRRGLEFVDLEGDDNTINWWVRGCCQYGIMPCNGLIYSPPHPCQCFNLIKFDGFHALCGRNSLDGIAIDDTDRLQKGPAMGTLDPSRTERTATPPAPAVAADQTLWAAPVRIERLDEWPTYRHDVSRSAYTPCRVPANLQTVWKSRIGEKPSGLVVARNRLLVSSVDRQILHCLDAGTGERLWEFVAGGRIDSPPTIARGMAVFGSRDGHVVTLRLSDGQLVWRFRGAPVDRRIVVRDRLESVWPIHGSVLVQDDVVYFAAGHTSYLDGGIRLYGLDLRTGEVKYTATVATEGTSTSGAMPDVLVSDGELINMRQVQFDARLSRVETPRLRTLVTPTGLLEDCWAHRLNWALAPGAVGGNALSTRRGGAAMPPFGKLLALSDTVACGVQTPYTWLKHDSSRFPPTHTGHLHQKYARYTRENFPIGTRIYARGNEPAGQPQPADPKDKKNRKSKSAFFATDTHKWTLEIPWQIRAMVMADTHLFVAGWRDSVKVFGDNSGADAETVLQCLSVTDGQKLSECSLDARPVFDGMAVAYGRLYLTLQDGSVRCLGVK